MIKEKILFVDDEINVLHAYQRQFRKTFDVETALGGDGGLKIILSGSKFVVIVADFNMPGMNGIEFLAKVKEETPNSVRMMLTGNANIDTSIKAVNEGNIFRFLTKPCPAKVLNNALLAAIEQYRLITAEKELLENTLKGSVRLLTEILSMLNPEAFGRAIRLRDSIKLVGKALKIKDMWELELASMLFQIGYVSIPPSILFKHLSHRILSNKESEIISKIPMVSSELINNIPRLGSVAKIVLYHNKRFDGTGFPQDFLKGKNIPLGSRILKILSDLEQVESGDVSQIEAVNELRSRKGWYDPDVLNAVFKIFTSDREKDASSLTEKLNVVLTKLRVGDILLSNIVDINDRVLIAARSTISQTIFMRLQNHAQFVKIVEPIKVERHVSKFH